MRREELSYIHRTLHFDKSKLGTNHHIRLKEYTPDRSAASFSFAVYLIVIHDCRSNHSCRLNELVAVFRM
jgi:hypothetical protein